MNILAIDPSINNIGWCLWDSTTENYRWGLLQPEGEKDRDLDRLVWRIVRAFAKLQVTLSNIQLNHLVCEYPAFFDNDRGKTAAKQGYTHDLAYICGYASAIYRLGPEQIHLYKPAEWKGNIPKSGIEFRFRRLFGAVNAIETTDHEQEATMLLRYFQQRAGLI